jgi:hypothetical protein
MEMGRGSSRLLPVQYGAMERDRNDQQRSWVDEAAALLRMVAGTDLEHLLIEHDGGRFTVRREPSGASREPSVSVTPARDEPTSDRFVVTSRPIRSTCSPIRRSRRPASRWAR